MTDNATERNSGLQNNSVKQDLKGKSLDKLKELCQSHGLKPFKAREIFKYINQKLAANFDQFTTLKLAERELLKENYFISQLEPLTLQKGQNTSKATFKLEDGKLIETAFMNQKEDRKTICVSSQAGCPIGCTFCATGQMGLMRNLTCAEIVSQAYLFAKTENVSNLVFMGMGEPFLNFNNVIAAAEILNSSLGLNIATRKIVFSTIGIIAGIQKLAEVKNQFRLAWSLVAPFEDQRRKLIPYKNLASITATIAAIDKYQQKTKRRVTIEYVVLKGVNDSQKDAEELIKIAQQLDSHVNLIPYNSSPGLKFEEGNITLLKEILQKEKILVTIRKSLGQDISAACGQLCTTGT